MIGYIKGSLEGIASDHIIVEAGSIGYEILTYQYVIRKLPELHSQVKIITYMEVKEDLMRLFGFLTEEEKTLFKQLISVSGLGPKGALSILDELGPDNLVAAIISNDYKAICKANGIGNKIAQKVILELKDKISTEGTIFDSESYGSSSDNSTDEISDAAQALVSLGYSNTDALKAIRKIEGAKDMKSDEILRKALKYL